MNRFVLLGSQFDTSGQEWAYVFDSQTGETFKSPVRAVGAQIVAAPSFVPAPPATASAPAVPFASHTAPTAPIVPAKPADPAGDVETPEQRLARIGRNKVPPALLGNISRMTMDPAKNANGVTDVMMPH